MVRNSLAGSINILVPVDFSPESRKALRVANRFANRLQATVHVCHTPSQEESRLLNSAPTNLMIGDLEFSVEEVAGELMQLLDEEVGKEHHGEVYASGMNLGREMERFVHESGIDLIIAAADGERNLIEFFQRPSTAKHTEVDRNSVSGRFRGRGALEGRFLVDID